MPTLWGKTRLFVCNCRSKSTFTSLHISGKKFKCRRKDQVPSKLFLCILFKQFQQHNNERLAFCTSFFLVFNILSYRDTQLIIIPLEVSNFQLYLLNTSLLKQNPCQANILELASYWQISLLILTKHNNERLAFCTSFFLVFNILSYRGTQLIIVQLEVSYFQLYLLNTSLLKQNPCKANILELASYWQISLLILTKEKSFNILRRQKGFTHDAGFMIAEDFNLTSLTQFAKS